MLEAIDLFGPGGAAGHSVLIHGVDSIRSSAEILRHVRFCQARGALVSNVDSVRLLVRAGQLISDVSAHLLVTLDVDPVHNIEDPCLRRLRAYANSINDLANGLDSNTFVVFANAFLNRIDEVVDNFKHGVLTGPQLAIQLLAACTALDHDALHVVDQSMYASFEGDPASLRRPPQYCHGNLKSVKIIGSFSQKSMVASHIIENAASLKSLTVDASPANYWCSGNKPGRKCSP